MFRRLQACDSWRMMDPTRYFLRLKAKLPQGFEIQLLESSMVPSWAALYNYAISKEQIIFFRTDSDGVTLTWWICRVLKLRHEKRCSWSWKRDGKRGDGKDRAFVEHVVCKRWRLYFKPVPDANAPSRLMKSVIINMIGLMQTMPPEYYAYQQ